MIELKNNHSNNHNSNNNNDNNTEPSIHTAQSNRRASDCAPVLGRIQNRQKMPCRLTEGHSLLYSTKPYGPHRSQLRKNKNHTHLVFDVAVAIVTVMR